jgi:hypothetical protein
MNNNDSPLWEKLVAQVSGPWDLVALVGGAALGAGITQLTHAPVIPAVTTGAGIGIAVEKSIMASFQRPILGRKVGKLRTLMTESPRTPLMASLLYRLDSETRLWKEKICSNSDFKKQLDKLIQDFRNAGRQG